MAQRNIHRTHPREHVGKVTGMKIHTENTYIRQECPTIHTYICSFYRHARLYSYTHLHTHTHAHAHRQRYKLWRTYLPGLLPRAIHVWGNIMDERVIDPVQPFLDLEITDSVTRMLCTHPILYPNPKMAHGGGMATHKKPRIRAHTHTHKVLMFLFTW